MCKIVWKGLSMLKDLKEGIIVESRFAKEVI